MYHACHLASYRYGHHLAGEAALTNRLSINIFPRPEVLEGTSRLLERGPGFLDRVSTMGAISHHVWYVKWASNFPCANGAASKIIKKNALEHVPGQSHEY